MGGRPHRSLIYGSVRTLPSTKSVRNIRTEPHLGKRVNHSYIKGIQMIHKGRMRIGQTCRNRPVVLSWYRPHQKSGDSLHSLNIGCSFFEGLLFLKNNLISKDRYR